MATYSSTEYTKSLAPVSGKDLTNGLQEYTYFRTYTVVIPDTAVADELVNISPELPVGTVVRPWRSKVICSADPGAGALALDVGIVAEDDLASLIDLAAGGIVDFDGVADVKTTAANPYIVGKLETLSGTVGAVTLTFDICFVGAASA